MPRSEEIIDRLHALHPVLIDLSLGRLHKLLAKLGHPERRLPPVVHVAGTNGKGSTCAFLRAIGEAAGRRVHVYTSPHLVRFHERIRLAGHLVAEEFLVAALEEVEEVNGADPITVFEITTAVALLLFSRVPADMLVLEVGLGGRYDATNVVQSPAVTAITSVSMDHMDFLGDTLEKIAFEKAGIIRPGIPCVTGRQDPAALGVISACAAALGTTLLARDCEWRIEPTSNGHLYRDAKGPLNLPPLGLRGAHQPDNAGIAVAAMRTWNPIWLTEQAILRGVAAAEWPARMQRLGGALAPPPPWELWLDGGHNAGAGAALAETLVEWRDRPVHLVVGMKQGKTAKGFLAPLLPLADSVTAVREPGQHLAMSVEEIVAASGGLARPGPDLRSALARIMAEEPPGRILICGSLYLAGEVLKLDGEQAAPSAGRRASA
ncbi:bifunctional folylpolyglutamate synthase/dihydrofolate synthase [Roseococcus sp. SYP-B2431]|uniref:bifunctional folylpolyglutamate synthase/dihydrofolate synthase n=1 Tax=Roseococcus sp. SYP-B2431 TaxID=2496640 RepID=UPI00103AC4C6|nr:folylpolyglutamate synthase/dihydrofolate synthase family protein [Roseococcus sp. SYP-B2431]TCH98592.1 bifunctional folylpolyglutamate synthase/dihydrofolate synthase [Roseococcus sp. SYP-B2431]